MKSFTILDSYLLKMIKNIRISTKYYLLNFLHRKNIIIKKLFVFKTDELYKKHNIKYIFIYFSSFEPNFKKHELNLSHYSRKFKLEPNSINSNSNGTLTEFFRNGCVNDLFICSPISN